MAVDGNGEVEVHGELEGCGCERAPARSFSWAAAAFAVNPRLKSMLFRRRKDPGQTSQEEMLCCRRNKGTIYLSSAGQEDKKCERVTEGR